MWKWILVGVAAVGTYIYVKKHQGPSDAVPPVPGGAPAK